MKKNKKLRIVGAKAVKEQIATCDSNGLKAHYECMECGKLYSDVKGKKEIAKSDVVINAKEHSMIFNKGKDATCTEDGIKEHYSCLGCNKKYSDKEGKMELSNNDIIKSKGHTEYIIPGYSATCSDNGITDGVKCSKCNKVLKEQQVVSKTGHNINYRGLEEPTYTEERVIHLLLEHIQQKMVKLFGLIVIHQLL